MHKSKSRQTKLMHIFQMENDFIKHREKIIKTQCRDPLKNIKKSYNSQMQMINSFKKKWNHSNTFKTFQQQKQISYNNQLLRKSILKQFNRSNFMSLQKQMLNGTMRSNSSSRVSLASARSKKKTITQQNIRLMKKIKSIQSTLSRNKMQNLYEKAKLNKDRLQVFSEKNKQRIKKSLQKMHIQPTISFPKMKQNYSTLKYLK